MHKSSFIPMVPEYIPWSEGYIPLFLQGTIVLGTVVLLQEVQSCCVVAVPKTCQKRSLLTIHNLRTIAPRYGELLAVPV